MSGKQLRFRGEAERDVDGSIRFYKQTASEGVALDFVEALGEAYRLVGLRPAADSPRYAHLLKIDGLRAWSLKRFPFVIFYVEQGDTIDIWRVLHSRRDIAASLSETSKGDPARLL